MIERSRVQLPAGALPGSLGQLSLPFYGIGKSSTSLMAEDKAFTCVGWQVTLCDLIWQVTYALYSEMGFLHWAINTTDNIKCISL